MNISARFPLKDFPPLRRFIVSIHFLLLVFCTSVFSGTALLLLLIFGIGYSAKISEQHYQSLISAVDDLSWNGQYWLMRLPDKMHAAVFFELTDECWFTRHYCLLSFAEGDNKHVWFFARSQLGDRAFSELVGLCRQQLSEMAASTK